MSCERGGAPVACAGAAEAVLTTAAAAARRSACAVRLWHSPAQRASVWQHQ